MPFTPAFLTPIPILRARAHEPLSPPRPLLHRRSVSPPAHCTPRMIQSPYNDGPPDLDSYFNRPSRPAGASGPPLTFSTGRAALSAHSGDPALATAAAISTARDALQPALPTLAHVTYSLDVDPHAVAAQLQATLPTVPVVGRSVNKKDAPGTIEVLLLRADAPVAFHAAGTSDAAGSDGVLRAAEEAAGKAVRGLGEGVPPTFLVFTHSPAPAGEDAARSGFERAEQGVVAYGGPAVGEADTGAGWSVLGGDGGGGEVVVTRAGGCVVAVAAVTGSLSFLASAVVKSWAQPAYVEPLAFMKAQYIGDASLDLLTAIRYDDWDKFVWCLGEGGVDVNVKWVEKQNQVPLLAACARARTRMVEYLLHNGADVEHRNDGGFTAAMYTRMLTEYDQGVVREQLRLLEKAGMDTNLSEEDRERLTRATNGKIVE